MRRSRARVRHLLEALRPFALPVALSVTVFLLSTLAFVYHARNDLLIFAAMQKHVQAAQILVALGARAEQSSDNFPEPAMIEYLHALYEPGLPPQGVELGEALLRAGASLSERSASGWTPLMLAAGSGQAAIAQLFVMHGADIDARGQGEEQTEGMTALMTAAMYGHAPIVKLLTDKGSNIHLRSRAGFTALLLAASRGHLACVEVLLQEGAAVPLSTVQVAERNGHKEVAERLRQAMQEPRMDLLSRRPAKTPEE